MGRDLENSETSVSASVRDIGYRAVGITGPRKGKRSNGRASTAAAGFLTVAAGIDRAAGIYDLRSTLASNSLPAGICSFELAKVIGTSDEDDRTRLTAHCSAELASIAARLAAFERLGFRYCFGCGVRRAKAKSGVLQDKADVAQLVERRLPKPKVAGSRPVVRFTGGNGNRWKSPANAPLTPGGPANDPEGVSSRSTDRHKILGPFVAHLGLYYAHS